jgi:hypothetical protein
MLTYAHEDYKMQVMHVTHKRMARAPPKADFGCK